MVATLNRRSTLDLRQNTLLLGAVLALLAGCGRQPPQLAPLAPDAIIVAFGDSLTAGYGLPANGAFPAQLAAHLEVCDWPEASIDLRPLLEPLGVKPRDAERSKNCFALGLVSWMYTRPVDATLEWIQRRFVAKPKVAAANTVAFKAGHAFGETAELFDHPYEVRPAVSSPADIDQLLQRLEDPDFGNGAVAPEEDDEGDSDIVKADQPAAPSGPLYDRTQNAPIVFGAGGEDASVIQLVHRVIKEAVERGTSHSDDLLRAKAVTALSPADCNLTTALVLGVPSGWTALDR